MERSRNRRGSHAYPRTARVNALLKEILAEELERRSDVDERLRLLTLTAVLCEPDLRHAKVLLASLPSGAAEALEEHRSALQARIGAEAHLRRTPALEFLADPAFEAAQRVEEALRRVAAGSAARADEGAPEREREASRQRKAP
jgi:ribosome-binding factor A